MFNIKLPTYSFSLTKDFFLTFSYCKSYNLLFILHAGNSEPSSAAQIPQCVSGSRLRTTHLQHRTRPKQRCTSGASAGQLPQALPSPRVYITAHCKRTFPYLHPEPQLIGTFVVDRGQTKFTHSMGRTSCLSANPGFFEGVFQARIASISSTSRKLQASCL